ncbi:MAG: hypothetical protein EOP00_21490 [Pedobacter sp.]|nr:MAG: hypothetical protein EOP00_21490 [Pedobacter sp.]
MSLAEPKCDGPQELNTLYDNQPFYSMGPNMISTQFLATLLGMSLSTIHLLKLGAFKLGYINIIPNKFLTDILVDDFWLFKKTHPYLHGLFITKTGDVYIKGCDSLYSERILTKRK